MTEFEELWRLDLSGNEFRSNVLSELSDVTGLRELELSGNDLSGPIPPELGSLSALKYMDIGFTSISGCIPLGLRGKVSGYRDLEYCSE